MFSVGVDGAEGMFERRSFPLLDLSTISSLLPLVGEATSRVVLLYRFLTELSSLALLLVD